MFFNNVPETRLQQAGFWGSYWGIGARNENALALSPWPLNFEL